LEENAIFAVTIGWATDGPQKYTGRSTRESHEHLNITPKEWEAFMDDLQQSLDKFSVPAAEQSELKASGLFVPVGARGNRAPDCAI
jgi:truncated hemoglobin YjbI